MSRHPVGELLDDLEYPDPDLAGDDRGAPRRTSEQTVSHRHSQPGPAGWAAAVSAGVLAGVVTAGGLVLTLGDAGDPGPAPGAGKLDVTTTVTPPPVVRRVTVPARSEVTTVINNPPAITVTKTATVTTTTTQAGSATPPAVITWPPPS